MGEEEPAEKTMGWGGGCLPPGQKLEKLKVALKGKLEKVSPMTGDGTIWKS